MAPKNSEEKTFEQNLQTLERIVEKLESGSPSLDKSIALFQEGRELGKACGKQLREAELRFQKLIEESDGSLRTEAFEPEQNETAGEAASE
ncbi:MAG: exodeoxyribonuclease VII small subunit [Candidatus Sumerlaeota bacterium]